MGWFPLGPREVYVPGYQTSREYVNRVNVSNTTVNNITITNVYNGGNNTNIQYANRNVRGGVTAVSRSTFTSAQPVGRAVVAVNPREIASAPVSRRAEVAPTRTSVFGTSAPGGNRVLQPPAEVFKRSVVAKTPPPPPVVPFERQQQKLAARHGQPLEQSEDEVLRPTNVPSARRGPASASGSGDGRLNQPGNQPASVRGQPIAAPANAGANPTAINAHLLA